MYYRGGNVAKNWMWMDEGIPTATINKPAQKVAFGDNAYHDEGPSSGLNARYAIQTAVWYPPREKYLGIPDVLGPHSRGYNVGYYDGHVKWRRPSSLRVGDFRAPGSQPPVPGYPGE